MKPTTFQTTIVASAFLAGALGCYWQGDEFARHFALLARHSSKGPTKIHESSVEEQVTTYFPDGERWIAHSVRGTDYDREIIREDASTILARIGHDLPEDQQATFVPVEQKLPEAYQWLLHDVGMAQTERSGQPAIERWLAAINAKVGRLTDEQKQRAIGATESMQAVVPLESPLGRAMIRFSQGGGLYQERGSELFEVGAFPDPMLFNDSTPEYKSSLRSGAEMSYCAAAISSRLGQPVVNSAKVIIRPRFLHVELIRPWLSEEFLSRTDLFPTYVQQRYFGIDGPLRLIPKHLIISAPSNIEIEPNGAEGRLALRELIGRNGCCKIICRSGDIFSATAHRVFELEDGTFQAYADYEPRILAIVSRRRVAR